MPVLHLGVVEIPYNQARGPRAKRSNSTVTTGDVAGWLEDEYHVMEVFANVHGADIGDDLAKSMAGALENLMMGAPLGNNVPEGTVQVDNNGNAVVFAIAGPSCASGRSTITADLTTVPYTTYVGYFTILSPRPTI